MHRPIVPLLSVLLLGSAACDDAKTEARKGEAKKASAAKVDAKKADAKKADVKKADAKKADAKDKDGEPTDKEASKDQERKARMTKALAELETWKSEEKTRWTDALQAEVTTLVQTKHKDLPAALDAVLASKHRHPANVERDQYRHPKKTLEFFGLRPDMTVIEVGPGRGWYTEILAPVVASGGKLIVTDYDPSGPEDQSTTLYGRRFQAFMGRSEAAYGKIERIVQKDNKTLDLGPEGSADMVFIARGLHGWVNREVFDQNVGKVHAALKPGGIAAIVQHRAKDDAKVEESAKQGYLPEAFVIEKFEAAGFTLDEKSDINANPKDTKDHPEGVWTLPPTLTLGDKDRDKWVEIGESDRMTLRFKKK